MYDSVASWIYTVVLSVRSSVMKVKGQPHKVAWRRATLPHCRETPEYVIISKDEKISRDDSAKKYPSKGAS